MVALLMVLMLVVGVVAHRAGRTRAPAPAPVASPDLVRHGER